MCGICGFIGKRQNQSEILTNMMNAIIHRGPDSADQYITEEAALGFRRLSIIDLENGSQPMVNETGEMALVFNGEIYNFQELRKELVDHGHIFKTHTDSEVLLHGYEEWGEKLLDRVRGMFAFLIWDNVKKEIFAARDFFGIKPFYYTIVDGVFVFGSEIKSILEYPGYKKELNEEALEHYLSFQYSVMNETFFKGIFKLDPGHFLRFTDGKVYKTQYFDPTLDPKLNLSDEELIKKLDQVIQESVNAHMIADVEVGGFLSSGVDSSLVVSEFSAEKTFTVGFISETSKYNEASYARELAEHLGLEHYSKLISREEYWDAIPKVMYYLDEPSGDPSAIALYFVAQEAAKKVKVVTSGEGADELFGGYNIYLEPDSLKYYQMLPRGLRKKIGAWAQKRPHVKGRNFLIRGSKTVEERFIGNANMFSYEERRKILKHPTNAPSPQEVLKSCYAKVSDLNDASKMQYIDLKNWLPGDILQKADKMSMAHSLELRVPFLDKEVFMLARQLQPKAKQRKRVTKYIFRKTAELHLPQKTSDKKKLGFPVPIRVWLADEEGYNLMKTELESDLAKKFFNTEELVKLLDDHKAGRDDNSRKIWVVYTFLVWYRVFFEKKKTA